MQSFGFLIDGLHAALDLHNLLYALAGVVLGMIVGALPGFGPSAGIAILMPLVFVMPPTGGLIMLGAIYYGNMYGNTLSSVLLNMPGDASGVATTFDGYKLAQQGRAGPALGIAAIASFVAGTMGVIFLSFMGPGIAGLAVKFGPAENFALVLIGLSCVAALTANNPAKGYAMAFFGLFLSMIGLDAVSTEFRMTFGSVNLMSGVAFTPIVLGFFGLAEVLLSLEEKHDAQILTSKNFWFRDVWPTRDDFKRSWRGIARGSIIGFVVGVLPGAGAAVATFLSYAYEKKCSKTPERFGNGAIEGVAAPEAANNAAVTGAFIPMLSLGIPDSSTTALLMAAIVMWGMQPGPLLFAQHPEVVWPFIASQYVGNIILVVANLVMVPVFVWALRVSMRYLNAVVGMLSIIGVFSVNNSMFDVWLMVLFGGIGYAVRKMDYPVAPLVLAFVLGPLGEESLRQTLAISGGSLEIFVARPISVVLLLVLLGLGVIAPTVKWWTARSRVTA